MTMRRTARSLLLTLLFVVSAVIQVSAEDSLDTARQLYAAAAYDEALAMLDRLHGLASDEAAPELEQERALCLLALNRVADAERAIAAVVQANPLYVPDGSAVSPRVRATFHDVRTRLMPDLVRTTFARARASFDRNEYARALVDFDIVLALMRDAPDAFRGNAGLEDLAVLAQGFKTLSEAALKPVETPAPAQAEAPPPTAPPSEDNLVERIFDATMAGVTPPVTINQEVPQWRPMMGTPPSDPGLIAVTISESGLVERLEIIRSLHPSYDVLLRKLSEKWQYMPATYDGMKVKFRKSIRLALR